MGDATKGGSNRARETVTGWSVCKFLALDTILLGGEGERDKRRSKALVLGDEVGVEEMAVANFEFDVTKPEGVLSIAGCIGVFARSKEEIEGHPNTIHGGLVPRARCAKGRGAKEYDHRDWFNAGWRVIDLFPGTVHSSETKVLLAGGV